MDYKIFVEKYKCFQDRATIEPPSLVNLVIGRNNCGKTTLSDVIEYVYSNVNIPNANIQGVTLECVINDEAVKYTFSDSEIRSGMTFYNGESQYTYGKKLIGKPLQINVKRSENSLAFLSIDNSQKTISDLNDKVHYNNRDWENLGRNMITKVPHYRFYRISAERDIFPEKEDVRGIDSKGNGITAKIDALLNNDGQNYAVISKYLLNDLNTILEGESHYSSIVTTKSQSGYKEICLIENEERIKLSQMGSGLKTILFVLLYLRLYCNNDPYNFYIFEELENNLHPEIQRRLFGYIYSYCLKNNCHVFITSHSHVAINCFYGKEQASIYRVYKKENGSSSIEKIESYFDKTKLLDDLGVKASDIFQANGIIWVEGPSDRVYINKWLMLKEPELKENVDYCFLYYGGKLLSHYTGSDLDDLIRIFLINRNGLIVMDSDIESEQEEIRDTKKRVKKEFEDNGMYVWVTKGREVENYIYFKDLNKLSDDNNYSEVPVYGKFSEFIKDYDDEFVSHKVEFAKKVEMEQESLNVLDLDECLEQVVSNIKKWNKK